LMLTERGLLPQALDVAARAVELARELGRRFSEACARLAVAKMDVASTEGLGLAQEAASAFEALGARRPAASAWHAVATACLLSRRVDLFAGALAAAMRSLELSKEDGDLGGQAIALQTVANCHAALKDADRAATSAYDALALFEETGDDYGARLASKLLESLGQTPAEIPARRQRGQQTVASAGPETKEAQEEKRLRDEEAYTMKEEQVLWEYTWMPIETQNPSIYGDKSTGPRKIFMTGQLQNKSLLRKLARCHPSANSKDGAPCLSNMLNGKIQRTGTFTPAMQASQCKVAIYDVTNLNRLGSLEVIDALLPLCQSVISGIEDRIIPIDIITMSTQALNITAGLREPFHSTLWGFGRTFRQENPAHDLRLLDMDAGCREEQLVLVCRWLLGAQTLRPIEVAVRGGQLLSQRLVGSRTELRLPVRMEIESMPT